MDATALSGGRVLRGKTNRSRAGVANGLRMAVWFDERVMHGCYEKIIIMHWMHAVQAGYLVAETRRHSVETTLGVIPFHVQHTFGDHHYASSIQPDFSLLRRPVSAVPVRHRGRDRFLAEPGHQGRRGRASAAGCRVPAQARCDLQGGLQRHQG